LWLVEDGSVRTINLAADGITPAGLAFADGTLYVSDLDGGIWAIGLPR
jgi:capsule polysaccharide export protein KpsC/LpsZ